jgi:hypothetical protein
MKPPKHRLSFNKLSDTEFEEFAYDLLEELGFVNLDWRKGTGKKTSPADSGRDIIAHSRRTDVDQSQLSERWFVDCKHYVKGVPAKELHNLLAWAQAERPDVALFVVSNFLSNHAKDYLEAYKRNNNPPFTIKVWERTNIESMTRGKRDLLQMHGVLKSYVRPESEIGKAEKELWDRVWYYRHMIWMEMVKAGRDKTSPDIIKMAKSAAAKKRKEYGQSIGKHMTDFEWGFMQGKFSALRWVLGDEWDFLDT